MSAHTDILRKALAQIEDAVAQIRNELDRRAGMAPAVNSDQSCIGHQNQCENDTVPKAIAAPRDLAIHQITSKNPLSSPEQAVISAISWLRQAQPIVMHRTLIAALAGYAPSEPPFQKALHDLSAQHLITVETNIADLTKSGIQIAIEETVPLTSETLAEKVAMQLNKRQRDIFLLLFGKRGAGVHRNILAEKCEVAKNGRGLYKELSTLQHLALIKRLANNSYACADMLFLD